MAFPDFMQIGVTICKPGFVLSLSEANLSTAALVDNEAVIQISPINQHRSQPCYTAVVNWTSNI